MSNMLRNYRKKKAHTGTETGGSDVYASNVVLSMAMDGINNGSVFTEKSGKLVTVAAAITSTSKVKFGTASGYFNGAAQVSLANSNDWNFGTGDFTVELQLNTTTLYGNSFIIGCCSLSLSTGWAILTGGDGSLYVFTNGSQGSFRASDTPNPPIAINTWSHIAVCRLNGTLLIYSNGVNKGTWNSIATDNCASTLAIGAASAAHWGGPLSMHAFIDEVRITKGVCRYPEAFIPPQIAFD